MGQGGGSVGGAGVAQSAPSIMRDTAAGIGASSMFHGQEGGVAQLSSRGSYFYPSSFYGAPAAPTPASDGLPQPPNAARQASLRDAASVFSPEAIKSELTQLVRQVQGTRPLSAPTLADEGERWVQSGRGRSG